MKQSEEREAIQNNINELKAQLDAQQARLDENADDHPRCGDVYERFHEECILTPDGHNVIVSGSRICQGSMIHAEFKDTKRLGTFDEVFVRRSQAREELRQELKEGFMKMKDSYNDRVTDCPPGGCSWRIESMSLGSFIDNLFDGKNCDGSDRDE
jgi:hypothetical protein